MSELTECRNCGKTMSRLFINIGTYEELPIDKYKEVNFRLCLNCNKVYTKKRKVKQNE